MIGVPGGFKCSTVPGLSFTRLPCDGFASSFVQIHLDRYIWCSFAFVYVDKTCGLYMFVCDVSGLLTLFLLIDFFTFVCMFYATEDILAQ